MPIAACLLRVEEKKQQLGTLLSEVKISYLTGEAVASASSTKRTASSKGGQTHIGCRWVQMPEAPFVVRVTMSRRTKKEGG